MKQKQIIKLKEMIFDHVKTVYSERYPYKSSYIGNYDENLNE